jgi:flagellar motor switch protein FliN/FliY
VTETIEYEQFDQAGGGAAGAAGSAVEADLSRLSDIPMELSVEIGRTHMTVGETLDLRVGSVVALERLSGETADLLVNGTSIARGEVVVIDEQYGLRITEILDRQSAPELLESGAPAASAREPGAVDMADADGAAAGGAAAGAGATPAEAAGAPETVDGGAAQAAEPAGDAEDPRR